MAVRIQQTGEVLSAYLSGELDHHTAKEMREQIDSALDLNMPTLLIIDFTDVGFMDSSGIGLVMGRYKTASEVGATLTVQNISSQVYKVMRLSGIDRIAVIKMKNQARG